MEQSFPLLQKPAWTKRSGPESVGQRDGGPMAIISSLPQARAQRSGARKSAYTIALSTIAFTWICVVSRKGIPTNKLSVRIRGSSVPPRTRA
jgi:hypothetical protein